MLKADRREPLVVVPIKLFAKIARAAEREKAGATMCATLDIARLEDVLRALDELTDATDLERLLRRIDLRGFDPPLTETDRADLLSSVAAATAWC